MVLTATGAQRVSDLRAAQDTRAAKWCDNKADPFGMWRAADLLVPSLTPQAHLTASDCTEPGWAATEAAPEWRSC